MLCCDHGAQTSNLGSSPRSLGRVTVTWKMTAEISHWPACMGSQSQIWLEELKNVILPSLRMCVGFIPIITVDKGLGVGLALHTPGSWGPQFTSGREDVRTSISGAHRATEADSLQVTL